MQWEHILNFKFIYIRGTVTKILSVWINFGGWCFRHISHMLLLWGQKWSWDD